MNFFLIRELRSVWLNLPIRCRGAIILAIPVSCLLFSLGPLSWLQKNTVQAHYHVQQAQQIRFETHRLLNALVDAETGIRGYSLTRQREFLEPYSAAIATIPKSLDKLSDHVKYKEQRQRLQKIEIQAQQRMEMLKNTLNAINDETTSPSTLKNLLFQGKSLMDETRRQISIFQEEEERLLKKRNQLLKRQQSLTQATLSLSAIIGIIGAITAALLFDRLDRELKLREADLRSRAIASQTQAEQLNITLQELQEAQARLLQTDQLIQTEKMSSLGQMIAGVAHEINNPVTFIHGNLSHVAQYTQDLLDLLELYQRYYDQSNPEIIELAEAIDLEFLAEDLPKILISMKVGANRIRQIVLSLQSFSRRNETIRRVVDIHQGIDSTLLILQHRLNATASRPSIEIVKEYGTLPFVECYAGYLNQAFMNILSNAIDAVEQYEVEFTPDQMKQHPRRIVIHTQLNQANRDADRDRVAIRIIDNGPGIPEEIRGRIFDPFFTTKPVGQGMGLGLSTSYQIVVNKHGGELKCFSQPGQGTEFWIEIPVTPPANLSVDDISSLHHLQTSSM